eukprot:snap_masked-scaffold_75-processed-gene-0.24-mRNA-1 protein AED:0.29 eAED:0.38 QI:0/0/0/0.4/1/1/5/0/324
MCTKFPDKVIKKAGQLESEHRSKIFSTSKNCSSGQLHPPEHSLRLAAPFGWQATTKLSGVQNIIIWFIFTNYLCEGCWRLIGETVGLVVGETLGDAVGKNVGLNVGDVEGLFVGVGDGATDGANVGDVVGEVVGEEVGCVEGLLVGSGVGDIDGAADGETVGEVEGALLGETVGASDGASVGVVDGLNVGSKVGEAVGRGNVGAPVGLEVVDPSPKFVDPVAATATPYDPALKITNIRSKVAAERPRQTPLVGVAALTSSSSAFFSAASSVIGFFTATCASGSRFSDIFNSTQLFIASFFGSYEKLNSLNVMNMMEHLSHIIRT